MKCTEEEKLGKVWGGGTRLKGKMRERKEVIAKEFSEVSIIQV